MSTPRTSTRHQLLRHWPSAHRSPAATSFPGPLSISGMPQLVEAPA